METTSNTTHFKDNLKRIYKTQNEIAPLIEGLELNKQTMDDYYVKL